MPSFFHLKQTYILVFLIAITKEKNSVNKLNQQIFRWDCRCNKKSLLPTAFRGRERVGDIRTGSCRKQIPKILEQGQGNRKIPPLFQKYNKIPSCLYDHRYPWYRR